MIKKKEKEVKKEVGEDNNEDDEKPLLSKYSEPRTNERSPNIASATYTFRRLHQSNDESLPKFVSRLRQSAPLCNFSDVDREIRDQIVAGRQSYS